MAQQGEAAPGLRGCASERPTGFGGERGSEGEAAIPLSLLSVSCLLWRERKTSHSSGMDGEDRHEKPASTLPNRLSNISDRIAGVKTLVCFDK